MPQYPGLDQMFQNLGPATASMFAGEREQLAQDAALQDLVSKQEAIREAQLKNIQTEKMNPLLITEKEAQNRKALVDAALAEGTQGYKLSEANNKAEVDNLQTAATRQAHFSKVLQDASVFLQGVPPVQRFSALASMAKEQGLDINNPAFAPIIKQAQSLDPNKLPTMLGNFSTQLSQLAAKNSAAYIQAMDVAKEHSRSAANVAEIGAKSREAAAAARNKGTQTIEDLVKSGKMTAEKAAVSFYGAAQFETDPVEKQRLLTMAQTYEQFAMQQRQATQAGKPDVGQIANLPTTQLPPSMGGGPKLGTKENPIKLD